MKPEAPPTAAIAPKRILLVDDHPLMREGVARWIQRAPGLDVCGEAATAQEAIALVAKLKPDLVITDISMDSRDGLELIKDLHVSHPGLPVVVLSMHEEVLYAERALRAGGRGYVMKKEGGERLVAAIQMVLDGGIAVSPKVFEKLLDAFAARPSDLSPLGRLTDRELEIFRLIGRGMDNAAITIHLRISAKTVDVHRAHIREKLGLATSTELIAFAARSAD